MSAYSPALASFPPPTLSDHPSLDVVLWRRHLCQGRFPRALRVRACAAQPGRLLLGHGVGGGASAPDTTFPSHARSSWAGGGVGTAVGRSHVPQRSAFLPRQDCGLFKKTDGGLPLLRRERRAPLPLPSDGREQRGGEGGRSLGEWGVSGGGRPPSRRRPADQWVRVHHQQTSTHAVYNRPVGVCSARSIPCDATVPQDTGGGGGGQLDSPKPNLPAAPHATAQVRAYMVR